jgi:hypothetical protein
MFSCMLVSVSLASQIQLRHTLWSTLSGLPCCTGSSMTQLSYTAVSPLLLSREPHIWAAAGDQAASSAPVLSISTLLQIVHRHVERFLVISRLPDRRLCAVHQAVFSSVHPQFTGAAAFGITAQQAAGPLPENRCQHQEGGWRGEPCSPQIVLLLDA